MKENLSLSNPSWSLVILLCMSLIYVLVIGAWSIG